MKRKDERFETLVSEALGLVSAIDRMKLRLEALHKELDPYYSGKGAVENIATEFGSAMRILDERITVDTASVAEVMGMLGSQFPKYFETKAKWVATDRTREILAHGFHPRKAQLEEYLVIERDRHFVFTPGKVRAVIDVA